jgi:hypothetical protein
MGNLGKLFLSEGLLQACFNKNTPPAQGNLAWRLLP